MANQFFYNSYSDQKSVADLISKILKKRPEELARPNEYTLPVFVMFTSALVASMPESRRVQIFNDRINKPEMCVAYGSFTATHGQRILIRCNFSDRAAFPFTYQERVDKNDEKLQEYINRKFEIDESDFSRKYQMRSFVAESMSGQNPVFANFGKRVSLMLRVYFDDNVLNPDEIGFLDPVGYAEA